MTTKAKATPVRVRPGISKPRTTDAQIVDTTQSSVTAMKASTDWPSATDVQTAATAWSAAATNIATNAATITQLKDQLAAAVAKQETLRQVWSVCTKQVLTSVDAFCANSLVKIQGFGFIGVSHAMHPLLDAPDGITTSSGPLAGEAHVAWTRGLAAAFVLQHATDTGNAATYSPSIPCTKAKFTFVNAGPSGSTMYVRLAAIDPHAPLGQSPWSAWVSVTVR